MAKHIKLARRLDKNEKPLIETAQRMAKDPVIAELFKFTGVSLQISDTGTGESYSVRPGRVRRLHSAVKKR